MRSDLILNTNNINKMIQFGTVKYGIVKQLKDRSKTEKGDITNDHEENGTTNSMPSSPIIECTKPASPEQTIVNTDEDLVHNNNLSETMKSTNTSSDLLLNKSYPGLMDDKITKTPSPALAEQQNNVADQPSSSPAAINRSTDTTLSEVSNNEITSETQESENSSTETKEDTKQEESREELNEKLVEVEKINEIEDVNNKIDNETRDDTSVENMDVDKNVENGKEASNDDEKPITRPKMCESPQLQMPQFPAGPVTLEVIQNMQMAIAQFAAKTFANGNSEANEAAVKQLAFLQQTLFNLQQQQLFQIQLIQQLQSQLAMNQSKETPAPADEEDNQSEVLKKNKDNNIETVKHNERSKKRRKSYKSDDEVDDDDELALVAPRSRRKSSDSEAKLVEDEKDCLIEFKKFRPDEPLEYGEIRQDKDGRYLTGRGIQLPAYLKQDENTPLPYGADLASNIITNHDDLPEPNSLEMLQKRAQEVLDSASQGILAGNLADELAFGKSKDEKNRNEPFFKHRCRYCGKVFGSDSALQIHIRSHTGERPFKCNVCGSRFTTKGNLKVHFQRHAQKFPHVPMNATPIPEHLDKFHPPLLDQMSSPESTPPHQPQMPPVPVSMPLQFSNQAAFSGLQSLYRPPLDILKSLGPYSNSFFSALPQLTPPSSQQSQSSPQTSISKKDQEMPTDLRKTSTPASPLTKTSASNAEEVDSSEKTKGEMEIKTEPTIQIKEEKIEEDEDDETNLEKRAKSVTPPPAEQKKLETVPSPRIPTSIPHRSPSSQPLMPMPPHNHDLYPSFGNLPPSFGRDDMVDHRGLPLGYRTSPDRRSPSSLPRHSPFLGSMKHPHEMALLPRPHSNDNSWENFIEISNTSETLKLKELMKNKKLTDPNQCLVCDRVLSCKSALQMHYRTHTGERPFKCRICGRAFTTKGNLKTHMAVHKIRPPMRNFHQCPVCHKKYSNALVLQQHIRLHTGEPTDLTPEQISAAEIRDFPPSMMPGSFLNPFAFNFGMGPHNGHHLGSESSLGEMDDNMDCSDDFDDDISDDHMSNGDDLDHRPKSRDEIKGMLFEQKLKIGNTPITNLSKSEGNTNSAPSSPISILNKSSPTPSDVSQGALDLTPKNSSSSSHQSQQHQQQSHQPKASAPRPPPSPPPMMLPMQLHSPPIHQPQSLPPQMPPSLNSNHPPHLNQMLPQRPPFGMFPNIPLFPPAVSLSTTQNMCNAMNSIAQSVMPSAPFNPLALSGVRGSTTCGICFKTFPCHSALEIHYRSHTKERPFKCNICDRGFTTKGNLKQHMLTHKIRDMEQDAFRNRAVKYEYMRNIKDGFE